MLPAYHLPCVAALEFALVHCYFTQTLLHYAGGTAMALASMAYFSAWGFFECDPVAAAGSVATIAAAATLMESLPLNRWLDDNISVPGTAALLGTLLADALVLA